MPPELRTVAASQGGLFTRRQAAGLGCSEREIKTRTGPGRLGDRPQRRVRRASRLGPPGRRRSLPPAHEGREHGFEDGVVAADAALRLGARHGDLNTCLERMVCWPNITRARTAVAVADGGAESIGETFLRLLVLELGIGRPETQFEVVSHGRRAFVDLRVGRHLFEFDGRVKYLGRELGGVADRRPEDVVWDEKRREDWLRNHDGGYGMSRVVWADLWGRAREDTKRRLAREFTESQERFGHLG